MILQILARCGAFFIGFIVKGQMNHDFAFGIEVNPCVIEITIGNSIIMLNGEALPVSRPMMPKVKEAILSLWGDGLVK